MNLTVRRFAFTAGPSAAAALMLFTAAAAGQQQPGDSATIAKVADSIAAEVLKAPVAGVAIGVARGGDVIYREDAVARAALALPRIIMLDPPLTPGRTRGTSAPTIWAI